MDKFDVPALTKDMINGNFAKPAKKDITPAVPLSETDIETNLGNNYSVSSENVIYETVVHKTITEEEWKNFL